MVEKTTEKQMNDPVQFIARIISSLPMILMKSGGAWLSFKIQARRGSKSFHKELIKQGLDKHTAQLFTDEYLEGSNLIKTLFNNS
jgi:hypothetical protein